MKIRNIVYVIAILVLFCSTSMAETILMQDGNLPVQENLYQLDQDHVSINFKVNRIEIKDVEMEKGTYARVALDETGFTRTVGKPMLPVIRRFVEIPMGADIRVDAEGNPDVYRLEDYSSAPYILPVQPPRPKCNCLSTETEFQIDEHHYMSQSYSFKVPVEVVDTGIIRGRRFAVLEVHLVDYNPQNGTLRIFPEIDVNVAFLHPDWEKTSKSFVRYSDMRSTSIADKLFINSLEGDGKTEIDYTAPTTYLVIGANQFITSDKFAEWIEWKTMKGYMVEVEDVANIGSTTNAIRSFIHEAYTTWEYPPSFVLLVGDTNVIPNFVGSGSATPATDLYYSTVDGDDIFADLGVGRFSVTNAVELEHIVNKTLQYEKATWTAGNDWLDTATFLASQDRNTITEGTHNWVCANIFEPAGINCQKLYSSQGTTKQQVLSAVSEGRFMVTFSGHGDVTGWVDGPAIYNADILNLNNTVYPFVSSFACLTGKYQQDRCFSEAWTRIAAGAVAMWASSVSSFWDEDDVLERGQMWGLFNGNEVPEEKKDYVEIPWFSGFTDFGKYVLYLWASGGGDTLRYFEMYNIMGDPETLAWTAYPVAPEVTHKNKYPLGSNSVSVTVDGDFVFALVSITAEGNLLGSKLVEPGEKAAIPLFDTVNSELNAVLTVTGHNLEPYIADIEFTDDTSDDDDDDTSDDDDDTSGDDDDDSVIDDDDNDDKNDNEQNIISEEDDDDDSSGCGC